MGLTLSGSSIVIQMEGIEETNMERSREKEIRSYSKGVHQLVLVKRL